MYYYTNRIRNKTAHSPNKKVELWTVLLVTPHAGCDHEKHLHGLTAVFNLTHPVRGATKDSRHFNLMHPVWGATRFTCMVYKTYADFNLMHPVRGAT